MDLPTLDSLEERACQGDASAFGALIRRHDADLRGVVWSVVRSADATDDVMQAAYEKAFRSIARFDRRSTMRTWLHSICYRAAVDYVRYESRRRHQGLDAVQAIPAAESPDVVATDRQELAALMEELEPDLRAMLMLTAGLGYSFDETAAIIGRPRGTVASKVGRLRTRIERWGDT